MNNQYNYADFTPLRGGISEGGRREGSLGFFDAFTVVDMTTPIV